MKIFANIFILSLIIFLYHNQEKTSMQPSYKKKPLPTKTISKQPHIIQQKSENKKFNIPKKKHPQLTFTFEKLAFKYQTEITNIYFHKRKKTFFKKIISHKNLFVDAKKILVPTKKKLEIDNNKQAVLRVFFLDVIDYAAKNGYFIQTEDILIEAIKNYYRGEPYNGQKEDLIDLMSSWLSALGEYKLTTCLECILSRINYHESLRQILATAIRYSFPELINNRVFVENFKATIESYTI
jgi:hypothetical protein